MNIVAVIIVLAIVLSHPFNREPTLNGILLCLNSSKTTMVFLMYESR